MSGGRSLKFTMIVKVVRPPNPDVQWLVYNRDKSYSDQFPTNEIPPPVQAQMREDKKAWFLGKIVNGNFIFGPRAEKQDW